MKFRKKSLKSIHKPKVKKVNPFELKFDRVKHSVLGKGRKGANAGKPGLSRKRAYENRANTLGVEWKRCGKVNKIVDRRLEVRNTRVPEEEKAIKRFAAERIKFFKSEITDIGQEPEEQLTHKGTTLTSIQKYDRTMSDDDDDDDEIGAEIVSTAHFGGGKEVETADDQDANSATKRKNVISEMISKTKQQRFDKKMARDELENATDRLDEKWKELMQKGIIGSLAASAETRMPSKPSKNDYESLFHELKMDQSRGAKATEREKTEAEVAFEEQQKLLKLESERLSRMGLVSKKNLVGSVDAVYEKPIKTSKVFEVKYDTEGKLIDADKVKKARIKVVRIDDESSDDNDSVADESYGEDEEDLDKMILDDEDEEASASTDRPDQLSSAEAEPSHLPFVFEMPRSYKELKSLLDDKSASEISSVVLRLIKCYHPSLHERNKKKLSRLLLYLLRYYDDSATRNVDKTENLGVLQRSIYCLLKFDAEFGARCVRALLKQQHALHMQAIRQIFGFRLVALVTLVERLFPVTDVFHPVCTPTLAFALYLIATVRVCFIRDAARILYLITVLTRYVEESKRYLPEVIAFLRGIFLVAVENLDEERTPTATFPISSPHRRMLFVENDCSNCEDSLILDVRDVFSDDPRRFEDDDRNKLAVLRIAIAVTCNLVFVYSTHTQSFNAIFRPFLALFGRLPRQNYPKALKDELSELESVVTVECKKNAPQKQLQRMKKETKMLEMLEPHFETDFNAERKYRSNTDEGNVASERKSLKRRIRKEMRGAMKELRKDTQFIARQVCWLNIQKQEAIMKDDRIRKEKTKRLMRELQGQESEYKKNLYAKQKA